MSFYAYGACVPTSMALFTYICSLLQYVCMAFLSFWVVSKCIFSCSVCVFSCFPRQPHARHPSKETKKSALTFELMVLHVTETLKNAYFGCIWPKQHPSKHSYFLNLGQLTTKLMPNARAIWDWSKAQCAWDALMIRLFASSNLELLFSLVHDLSIASARIREIGRF